MFPCMVGMMPSGSIILNIKCMQKQKGKEIIGYQNSWITDLEVNEENYKRW